MADEKAKQLAHYIKTLGLEISDRGCSSYKSMSRVVIDGILQAGFNYQKVVAPKLKEFADKHPNVKTLTDFAKLAKAKGGGERGFAEAACIGHWNGPKPQRIQRLVEFLLSEGVDTVAEFRRWSDKEENIQQLRRLNGIGPKTVDYLQMIVGKSEAAVDVHMERFVKSAGIQASGYDETKRIVLGAAKILGVKADALDAAIWLHQSAKGKKKSDS